MPLLFLAIDTVLVTSLWSTHQLFLHTFRWEKRQIATDNASIELGKLDRILLNWMRTQNDGLSKLELKHHFVHECAQNAPEPQVRSACKTEDLILEVLIDTTRNFIITEANTRWQLHPKIATEKYIHTIGISGHFNSDTQLKQTSRLVISHRSIQFPATSQRCSVCRKLVHWELDEMEIPMNFHLKSSKLKEDLAGENLEENIKPVEAYVALMGRSLISGKNWDYRLSIVPVEGNL